MYLLAVIRVEKTKNYTVMSNVHLRDKALSLKAKGLLSLILSLPDEWEYSIKGLAAISKEGRDGINSGLQELESAGYLVRKPLRGAHGHFGQVEYVIYETPQPPNTDIPDFVQKAGKARKRACGRAAAERVAGGGGRKPQAGAGQRSPRGLPRRQRQADCPFLFGRPAESLCKSAGAVQRGVTSQSCYRSTALLIGEPKQKSY